MDKDLRKYLRKIRSMIPSRICDRKMIMESIESSIQEYISCHPEASTAQIKAFLGTPEHVVASYVGSRSAVRLLDTLRIRKIVTVGVICAMVIVFFLSSWFIFDYTSFLIRGQGGYITEEVFPLDTSGYFE